MKTEDKEFEPYGPEWEKEMLKFTKIGLIQMLRKSLKENISTDMAYEKGWTDARNPILLCNKRSGPRNQ